LREAEPLVSLYFAKTADFVEKNGGNEHSGSGRAYKGEGEGILGGEGLPSGALVKPPHPPHQHYLLQFFLLQLKAGWKALCGS